MILYGPRSHLLDEALLGLHEPDRLAIIMHFMEGQTFQEVGSALGIGEDTARKRVNRCFDQLTHFFRRRGFEVPALTAGAPLFALSSHAAPAGLTASAAAAGLGRPFHDFHINPDPHQRSIENYGMDKSKDGNRCQRRRVACRRDNVRDSQRHASGAPGRQ